MLAKYYWRKKEIMTKIEKSQLIEIFTRIQTQLKFFEKTPEDVDALREGINDICLETLDSLRKNKL